jgi:septal ring factor EnvC (AmiA/AmiB activator)
MLALVGRLEALSDERTLVEVPADSLAAAAESARATERARLEEALAKAEAEIKKREASLKEIGARLEPLRRTIEEKMRRTAIGPGSSAPAPSEVDRERFEVRIRGLEADLMSEQGRRIEAERALDELTKTVRPSRLVSDLTPPPERELEAALRAKQQELELLEAALGAQREREQALADRASELEAALQEVAEEREAQENQARSPLEDAGAAQQRLAAIIALLEVEQKEAVDQLKARSD